MTEDDIVATLSAIANGQARIVAPTYTALGQESILQEVPVNGYTLYAEEIIRTGKEKPSNLEGRTIYKTPTKTTALRLGTSPSVLPRNLGGASTNSIHENINLSTGNILLNNAGVEQDLYVAVVNGYPVSESGTNGLIFLSADKSNIDAPDGSIRKVHIKTEKPFYITADNVVYKSSTDNVAQKVKALEDKGFDCFIFDYHEGDRYAVMVKNKAQILPAESASPSFGKVKDSVAMPNADSEGNALTEAQQKFFSGSLVTDEDGALLPVYHATDSAEFTVFDKSKLGYNTDGNTSDEGMAATAHVGFWFNTKNLTGKAGSRAEKVYLNLTNPYELTSLDALAEEIKALGEGETPAEMGEAYATDLWLRGYDGIEIRNDEEFGGTSYVAFDENQIKRTTNKNPTKDADIRYSTSLSDYARIVSDRIDAAARGRQTSVSEVLRRNEKEARDVKREFLPDMKTVGEVAHSFAEMGLAEDATAEKLVKATTDAAVAMRAAYLERRIANEATKDAKSRTAAKKLLEAAEMVKLPDGMSKTQVAAAMADAQKDVALIFRPLRFALLASSATGGMMFSLRSKRCCAPCAQTRLRLRAQKKKSKPTGLDFMVAEAGFEPTTFGL